MQSNANVPASPACASQSASGVLGFVGSLFARPGLFGFLASGRSENAVIRGSLVGLASGVEAVTEEDATGKTTVKQGPFSAAFTVFVYILEGIIAALVFREVRRAETLFAEQCRYHDALGWTEPHRPKWLEAPAEILPPETAEHEITDEEREAFCQELRRLRESLQRSTQSERRR